MKIYIHYEPDDKAILIRWINNTGTISDLIEIFVQTYQSKYKKQLNPKELVVTNSRNKELNPTASVTKNIKEGDDLYVWIKGQIPNLEARTEAEEKSIPKKLPQPQKIQKQPPKINQSEIKPKGKHQSEKSPPKKSSTPYTREELGFLHLEDPAFPEKFEASCPICGEFISYHPGAKKVKCETCSTVSIPVTFVDAQSNCARCNKLVYRIRGKRVIVCNQCGFRSAAIQCRTCHTPFVFPEGIAIVPCVNCDSRMSAAEAICNSPPKLGLLINSEVNEPADWENEFNEKKTFQKKIHVITQWFKDSSSERQREIDSCFEKNILCRHIDQIHVLLENNEFPENFRKCPKIKTVLIGKRWKFKDAFEYCNKNLEDEICVVANADIFFDQSLNFLQRFSLKGKFLAITRHDLTEQDTYRFNEWIAPICQDVWIFQSPVPHNIDTDYYFGMPGCDNRIAYEFKHKASYHILNPCLKIITRHVHMTEKRNYTQANKVEGNYAAVPPNVDM